MRCDIKALGEWCPTFRDSAMAPRVGMSMQWFGTFLPLNIERTTLPQTVGIHRPVTRPHMPQGRRPQDGNTQCSNWWCVRLYQKEERTKINKVAFVAVLLGIYLNLCILVLNYLYRINGYSNATNLLESNC
jgi:hypothetical protein